MAQIAVPISPDVSNAGGWIPISGSWPTFPIYEEINEGVSGHDSNTSRIQTPAGPVNCACEVTLGSLTDPSSSTGHILRIVTQNLATPSQMDYTILLKQGGVTKATWTFSQTTGTYDTSTYTLSGAEADSITDYTALTVSISVNQASGSNTRGRVTALEFEVPDVAGTTSYVAWIGDEVA